MTHTGNDVTQYNHVLSKCLKVQNEMRRRKNTPLDARREQCSFLSGKAFLNNVLIILTWL